MTRKHNPKVSAELEAELRDRLEDVLDAIDDTSDKRRRISKKLGGHLKVLSETRDLVRRQLKGIDLDQVEIPGTELPAPAEDPLVKKLLELAGGIVRSDGVEPLVFRDAGPDAITATVRAGVYQLERLDDVEGSWIARWSPLEGRGKVLGQKVTESVAKELCRRHHLDRAADERLGDDKGPADTKGPPEKRK